uniref:Uncharacterized protein n=1 Tax=Vespula pensylvanica TaxID=30213 RepID=A0A834PES6_VESPE|nr:hypothetical protein H0235_000601 [Vespula pensylvanica]
MLCKFVSIKWKYIAINYPRGEFRVRVGSADSGNVRGPPAGRQAGRQAASRQAAGRHDGGYGGQSARRKERTPRPTLAFGNTEKIALTDWGSNGGGPCEHTGASANCLEIYQMITVSYGPRRMEPCPSVQRSNMEDHMSCGGVRKRDEEKEVEVEEEEKEEEGRSEHGAKVHERTYTNLNSLPPSSVSCDNA